MPEGLLRNGYLGWRGPSKEAASAMSKTQLSLEGFLNFLLRTNDQMIERMNKGGQDALRDYFKIDLLGNQGKTLHLKRDVLGMKRKKKRKGVDVQIEFTINGKTLKRLHGDSGDDVSESESDEEKGDSQAQVGSGRRSVES